MYFYVSVHVCTCVGVSLVRGQLQRQLPLMTRIAQWLELAKLARLTGQRVSEIYLSLTLLYSN